MASTVVILNPGAGRAADDRLVRDWAQNRPDTRLRVTDAPGDARRFAHEAVAEGIELLVVAGGDGTVAEVVNGLKDGLDTVTMAVVPMGTGNDLARTLGLPVEELDAALRVIDDGDRQRIDLVRASTTEGDRLFTNAANGAFSDLVRRNMTRDLKRKLGPLAYLVGAARAFRQLRFHHVDVHVDDEWFATRACMIVLANGQFLAGGHQVAPNAVPDDGQLDLSIVTAQTLGQRLLLMFRFAVDNYLESRLVVYRRAARVRIEADPPMAFTIDGEPVGNTPAEFEVMPGALQVIVPTPGE